MLWMICGEGEAVCNLSEFQYVDETWEEAAYLMKSGSASEVETIVESHITCDELPTMSIE